MKQAEKTRSREGEGRQRPSIESHVKKGGGSSEKEIQRGKKSEKGVRKQACIWKERRKEACIKTVKTKRYRRNKKTRQ